MFNYHQLLLDSIGAKIFGFEDMGIGVDTIVDSGREPLAGPLEKLQSTDFKKYLAQLIAGLCHKESLVLTLYYNEELNLKEIGEVLS